ncbi:hypothetical protein Srubr_65660 [Streptomyces rubradiris]|uniref:Uncharacterized protein n=1 Tax=Streptomyces rubradiris TaxID=285531 RepID=A0ABQ3RLH9_STRRR|nr:hypothetical protein GCM10018792_33140 [Streptomyces rubradiris]GHI56720.1 hypothetical protein Srubr_65660 [Streptomyces rubradiris]
MDQISTRTLLLLFAGVFTVYLVLEDPAIGAALGTAIAVVTLLEELLRK